MSYDIIYNKQFIKLRKTGEVIPMILSGSNNCFEVGNGNRNGRRSRDWQNWRYYNRKGKLSVKPEVLLKNVDAGLTKELKRNKANGGEATPKDIKDRFGYYVGIAVGGGSCGSTSWGRFRSIFTNGIRGAKTIEALAALGVRPYFMGGYSTPDGKPSEISLFTEKDYFEELKKWQEWAAKSEGKGSFYMGFSPTSTDIVLERLLEARASEPKEKTTVEQDHYFALCLDNYGCEYLVKYTPRGFRYTEHAGSAKKFLTEKAADKYRLQLVARGAHKAGEWQVKRIEQAASFMVAKGG